MQWFQCNKTISIYSMKNFSSIIHVKLLQFKYEWFKFHFCWLVEFCRFDWSLSGPICHNCRGLAFWWCIPLCCWRVYCRLCRWCSITTEVLSSWSGTWCLEHPRQSCSSWLEPKAKMLSISTTILSRPWRKLLISREGYAFITNLPIGVMNVVSFWLLGSNGMWQNPL